MIPIDRGAEPPKLAPARDRGLARIAAIVDRHERPRSEDFSGYEVVRDELWATQAYKCCYCESREQKKRNDVEHFRPKTRADRRPLQADPDGYWWLAWTWENLLFACRNCNRAPAKVDRFPLAEDSPVLKPGEHPPGTEKALLIDPSRENGIDHIRFRPDRLGRWMPTPRNGSEKGLWTIKVCMLDRADLLDMYTAHVEGNVRPFVARIDAAVALGDPAAVRHAWEDAVGTLLVPQQAHVGLAYDALEQLVPSDVRTRWGLTLSEPQIV